MHPCEEKLKTDIYPYLISARQLDKWWVVWVYTVYTYTNALILVLIGLGLSSPVTFFLVGKPGVDGGKTIWESIQGHPWTVMAFAGLVGWGMFMFFLKRNDVEKRYNLVMTCRKRYRVYEASCQDAVREDDPMISILNIYKGTKEVVTLCITEDAWPKRWNSFAPGAESEATGEVDKLVTNHRAKWKLPPTNEREPK